jgi:hypothetical protein
MTCIQSKWNGSQRNENGGLVVRIALLGCGEHSRSSHAAPLARYAAEHRGEIELVAACDLNADRAEEFCRTFGFARQYTDLDRMLDEEKLDGCVSVLPIEHIVNTGIELLNVGCRVLSKNLSAHQRRSRTIESRCTRNSNNTYGVRQSTLHAYLNQVRSWIQVWSAAPCTRSAGTACAKRRRFHLVTTIHVMDALRHIVGEVETFDVDIQQPGDLRPCGTEFHSCSKTASRVL